MFVDKSEQHGFTLVELLVVIAIILILAAALLFAINPAALLEKSRDSQRVSDLSTLSSAIALYFADEESITGVTDKVFTSLAVCTSVDNDSGFANAGNTNANINCPNSVAITGSGWVNGINFNNISTGTPISALPIDPTNTFANDLFYRYCNDNVSSTQYVIDGTLESSSNDSKEDNDGGTSGNRYELGSRLDVCGTSEM